MKIRLLSLALVALCCRAATTITDTNVRFADGTLASGRVEIRWPTFRTSAGVTVPAGIRRVTITNGTLSVALEPTDETAATTPRGVYYTVGWFLTNGQQRSEYWVIPTSGSPVTLSSVALIQPLSAVFLSQLQQSGATNGQYLTFDATSGRWAPSTLTSLANPMIAVGDMLIGGTSGSPTRLAGGTNGYCLTMTAGSPAWSASCGAGSAAFSAITGGTNTAAAMIVGSGASLTYGGSGTVDANRILGTTITGRRGVGTQVQMTTGAVSTNDCAKFDANGDLVSAGAACGSGGGGGTANYSQSFTSQTSVVLTHGHGTPNLIVTCYNASEQEIGTNPPTIGSGPAYDVTVTFTQAQTGRCVVNGSGGGGSPAFSAVTTGTNTAALLMGSGGSLDVSGSGTIRATRVPNSTTLPGTCSVGDVYMDTDAASGARWYLCEASNSWVAQGGGGGGGGATTALDNLASVNINSALLFQSGIDVGSTTKPLRYFYWHGGGTYGTNYFHFTGTPTAARTITFPDASGTATLLGNTSTGSGSVVLATSPALTTPALGVASATTLNKYTFTAPAAGATLTIADGKTLTVNNSITFAGTDATTMTLPSTTTTLAGLGVSNTFTSANIYTAATLRVPNSTTLPGTCTVGDSYMDTDATTGARWYLCESTNTWVVQGGGGGGGGSTISVGAYGSLPGSPGASGSMYRCTDCRYEFVSNGSAWLAFDGGQPATLPGVASGWTTAGSPTVADSNGSIALTVPKSTTTDFRVIYKALVTNTAIWKVGSHLRGHYQACGPIVGDAGTKYSMFMLWQYGDETLRLAVNNFSNVGNNYASTDASTPYNRVAGDLWVKAVISGASTEWSLSMDGVRWDSYTTSTYTSTVTKVGFGCDAGTNNTYDAVGQLISFSN